MKICCIPADNKGDNKLWIKEFRKEGERTFVKYKSTYNDIPFVEVEVFIVDGGKNIAITGDDGTVLWRFPIIWINKIL